LGSLTAGMPITQSDAVLLQQSQAPARAGVARQEWEAELAAGRALTQEQALAFLLESVSGPPPVQVT
jgi:hypothetical protein